jgi:dihydroorotase
MGNTYILYNAQIVNEGEIYKGAVYIAGGLIQDIFDGEVPPQLLSSVPSIDAGNKLLIPGVIDDQVHFRDPGLTYKGDIYTESKAGIAGGVTSFMDMPNTKPQTISIALLEEKFKVASEKSLANYSFYLGATNDNYDELDAADRSIVCGIKVFMGASTGNMLVDQPESLKKIFSIKNLPVAVHCEDEPTIRKNTLIYKEKFGENIPVEFHPQIRSAESCYLSSSKAVDLAKRYGTRLHVIHLSTAIEIGLFTNEIPLEEKQITTEVCIHHLWFDKTDYQRLGSLIKWNPAIKSAEDKDALLNGLLNNTLDIIATDHSPHTYEEKQNPYTSCPSGGPLVQHSLIAMLELSRKGKLTQTEVVNKMCHAPAKCFKVEKRGFIRKGYFADLAIIDVNEEWTVSKSNILYKCGWSPFEGEKFHSKVTHTFVNGHLVFNNGVFDESVLGNPLSFSR